MPTKLSPSLNILLKKVEIPTDVSHLEGLSEASTILSLEEWKQSLAASLNDILLLVRANEDQLDLEDKGNFIFYVLPHIPSSTSESDAEHPIISLGNWTTDGSQRVAQELEKLPTTSKPSRELVTQVLTENLRSIFKASPHPYLHADSGRRLHRPAGGAMGKQDYYDGQRWKQYPGIANVVLWCVHAIETDAFEQMWHLIVPPVMTLLDDYEPRYKLQGVTIVQALLSRVPPGLLKRTGIDGLFRQSLRNALSHLESPETPQLLRSAIRASVDLVVHTTSAPSSGSKPSSERFDQLCSLLGEGIITGIWLYAEDKPLVVTATFDSLPHLVKALGIGTVRFQQALIPQLAHTLIPRTLVNPDRDLQLSALMALEAIMEACRSRISPWKETILDAVGRCWVQIVDEEHMGRDLIAVAPFNVKRNDVKAALQLVCEKLALVYPAVVEEDYSRFLAIDKSLFEGLLVRVPT